MTTVEPLRRVYVWQIPVRVTHWLIASSIIVLSITGFYIGRPMITVPGPAGESFFMGWVKVVHGYVAYVFLTAVIVRLIWMFTGNNYAHWDKFLPVHRTRRKGMLPTIQFYSFLRDRAPGYVGHNPLAGFTYVAVFGLYLLTIATGLLLRGSSAPADSLLGWYASLAPYFGGLQVARWIHHAIMWLLLGFMLHHVYSSILMASVEKNGTMDSIFTGYKWVPKQELEPGPYRWNHGGELDE